jgi:hypothetical protein
VQGLSVENLVGDLACYYAQQGGRVLVFDARAHDDPTASPPAWSGPAGENIRIETENYLNGRTNVPAACFAPTLIAGINYTRGDVSAHMNGVIEMHRFRQLVQLMRDQYALTLLITRPSSDFGADDFLPTLADGIVAIVDEKAGPRESQIHLDRLNESDAMVYGAVAVGRDIS